MAQSTFSVRMDKQLKQQFDSLCEEFGMNTTTAFNIFARAVVRNKKIPFEISSNSLTKEEILAKGKQSFKDLRTVAKQNDICNMTLDEINQEISLARTEKNKE
jgi:DNA-damage-inducible protein J